MADLSITETPNLLTSDIDIADSAEIFRLLSKTDSEIFHGWNENGGLYDPVFLANLVHAAEMLADMLYEARLARREARIIFSGAGTSGRIAMLLADEFSDAFQEVVGYSPLDFCIAGGNGALIKAKEGAEDDPHAGIADLEKRIPDSGIFAAVGITCGFSANYIAGQIHWTVLNKNRPAVLVGFNPARRARAVKPENWDKSFADVIGDVSGHPSMILLNPVIGPEPVTGSTRMKGGSATKIIGESLLYLILNIVRRKIRDDRNYSGQAELLVQAEQLIRGYENAVQAFYQSSPKIAGLLDRAGQSLNAGGKIVYLGERAAGRLGIIDASECPPTFGAGFEDVRGFCPEGWKDFCPSCEASSFTDPLYDISFAHFKNAILPGMSAKDTLILSGTASFYKTHSDLFERCRHIQPFRIFIQTDSAEKSETGADYVLENAQDFDIIPMRSGLQIKLIYNAVTTAAHIFKGKVYSNKMIDLRISNNKLYYRSLRIIQEITGASEKKAEEALLSAIYESDAVSDRERSLPVSHHILKAAEREKIVPAALVLASGNMPYAEALKRIENEHIIRNIIKNL